LLLCPIAFEALLLEDDDEPDIDIRNQKVVRVCGVGRSRWKRSPVKQGESEVVERTKLDRGGKIRHSSCSGSATPRIAGIFGDFGKSCTAILRTVSPASWRGNRFPTVYYDRPKTIILTTLSAGSYTEVPFSRKILADQD